LKSGKYNYHSLSELAACLGTLEFNNGSYKKAKKLLKISLIDPNDNALAQIEWINSNFKVINTPDINELNIANTYEALTIYNYFNENYEESLEHSINWYLDLPFSKAPILYSALISTVFLGKRDQAIMLLKEGLHSHPGDPKIINELAYALALENELTEANNYLGNINDSLDISPETKTCLIATEGLISIREGNPDKGNAYYLRAIEAAKSFDSKSYLWLAKLNYAREIILNNLQTNISLDQLLDVPDKTNFPSVNKTKKDVLEIYQKSLLKFNS
jgi:tetratricopeptide (TPR) repeat protein